MEQGSATFRERNHGIDLLRIISMLMIIMLHVIGQGGIIDNCAVLSVRYEIVWLIRILTLCSVNCFALISGYVGVESKHRYSNLSFTWLQVVFYTVIITILFFAVAPETIGKPEIVRAVFPVLTGQYWYFTAYFITTLLSPLFNTAVNNSSERMLRTVLLSVLVLVSVLFPVFRVLFDDTLLIHNGYSTLWIMILYLSGAYIKKYGLFEKLRQRTLFLLYLGSSLLTWGSKYVIALITDKLFGEIKYDDILVSYLSVTTVISAISLLLFFSRMRVRTGQKLITLISSLSFGVYLIHMHPLVFNYLLKDRFEWCVRLPVYQMIPMIVLSALMIFIICCVIDSLRYYLFNALEVKKRLAIAEEKLLKK